MSVGKKILCALLTAAVVIWMAVIFSFSSESGDESSQSSGGFIRYTLELLSPGFSKLNEEEQTAKIESFDHFVRKAAHFTVYTVLGALLYCDARAFGLCGKRAFICAVVIGAAYAVSDEVHQYFVPGRACMLRDMLLDTCGVMFGSALALLAFILGERLAKRRGGTE